ncbi:MAG TPA: Crp/Fnr family transcriptional regulator [Cyclobacteriaceae bacterium]|nr:Crp/Fnr family transcriptional regulator [Cyclobacteriaceae bacterium]MCB9238284.1 Crp/Fnr family transcriptional regulator [Flammeovirgaceae bacterium]MCB0499008.1 Crp/Fnr family transcriptional regulator [Cyclobacteriaceae bacterium]MCO5272209.1 Crp/Fnr family transcriptional regulator [Cyclobacteriaceae bacterium]MCW5902676.1 Crp/Fnr family transcriptional regulator [Cyclobacteriaceae bacterium]
MKPSRDLFKKLISFTEPRLQEEILANGNMITAGKGDVIIREGQYLNFMPIVIGGLIRVYQEKDDREILLYYVGPGQTCMMSLSSAYFDYNSTANGMAMEPSEVLVLPAHLIADWQLRYPSWNKFIIQTFKSRYDELLSSFTNVAFKPVHLRIEEYLNQRAKDLGLSEIQISHQSLANELGTTRVVVSRILKQLEIDEKVRLRRGSIQVL